jgi:calcineurin-like phosphoesterase family protein
MTIWITSDLHIGHHGVCKFINNNGTKMRPWDSIEQMDEELINRFNEKVLPEDKCYILGDIALNQRAIPYLERLNCRHLRLIKGNHDVFSLDKYLPFFEDIRGSHVLENMILTHIPVHPSCLSRWSHNIHGHLHGERILLENGKVDSRYINVSVEQTNFYPISLEELIEKRDNGVYYD